MRILFLSQRVPYPPNRGDKITTWRLIERMRRDHEVRVVAFAHDASDLDAARELRDMGYSVSAFPMNGRWARIRSLPLLLGSTPMTLGVYGSKRLQAEVDRWAGESDLAYAYSSSMGAFLRPHAHLARVMHFAELDSDKWRQYAERSRFPGSWVYRREWRTLRRFETDVAHSFDENVFCTPLEQDIFDREIPGASSVVLRNGVDLDYFRPNRDAAEPANLVFTGVMDYLPNIDACVHFANDVLPGIREQHPDARFTIVGAHPTPEVLELGKRDGIHVTGFVEDVRDWLVKADLAVAPLRIARGIQNKVLEAMAMGLPTVGSTSATQGIAATPGEHYVVADDPADEARAVCELLNDREGAEALGRRARQYVEDHYDWEVVLQPLDEILERCAREHSQVATPASPTALST